MKTVRSILFYIILICATLVCGLSAILVSFITGRRDLAHLCGRAWANVNLWASGVTVRMQGLEKVQRDHPYIYAANHQSLFDIFVILGRLPVQFRWLAKEELFRIPILGQAMSAIGYIPIDRKDRHKAFESLNQAAVQVQNGTSIVIFPEGTRSSDGVLQDFKKGGFILAIKSQQPIVPITISGSFHILPKKSEWLIEPGIINMTIHPPVPTAGLGVKDRDGIIGIVREAIRRNLPLSEGGVLTDDEGQMHLADCRNKGTI
jgi:1-acyl-sn-glycerol-3-phosphate acyltransferase